MSMVGHLNIFLETYATEAIKIAKKQDKRRAKGEKMGRLAGVVVALKDVICYKDHEINAASNILDGFKSLFSATVVERLLAEDAIIIGSVNCDEFAMGGTNEYSAFGPTLNAADPTRVPGGSSGGSAVAVQANCCLVALGSDTGGSVRQPAAYCGVYGFKPSYGRLSRHGLIAYASSFDQIGFLTHSLGDIALLTEICSGPDQFDSTLYQQQPEAYNSILKDKKPKRIAYFKEAMNSDVLDPEIRDLVAAQMKKWESDGHIVEGVEMPELDYMVPAYYIMTAAEASSNLSRFDGIHYGYRSPNATDLESTYVKSRSEGFGDEVKRRIMLGTFVLSAGYYDAYYTKAQKIRQMIVDKCEDLFSSYDFICTPTNINIAPKLGELKTEDPVKMYMADIFTVSANLIGAPALSIPMEGHSSGMPIGIQLIAKRFNESAFFEFVD
ncbi:UNVERIFIED_CONTAM: hypothetical protein GTU68_011687 [Idotea baltica]|nr:hypothetical protein [Idotea baltica]